jgi:hypothetical protein
MIKAPLASLFKEMQGIAVDDELEGLAKLRCAVCPESRDYHVLPDPDVHDDLVADGLHDLYGSTDGRCVAPLDAGAVNTLQ